MVCKDIHVRKRSLHDEDNPLLDHASITPAERILLAWELTLQAWRIQGGTDAEPRLQKHVVRVLRRGEAGLGPRE
jgi:hypothetical protein